MARTVVTEPTQYRSYLLRQWKESPDLPWRYYVLNVNTGDEQAFANLAQLFSFLRAIGEEPQKVEPGIKEGSKSP